MLAGLLALMLSSAVAADGFDAAMAEAHTAFEQQSFARMAGQAVRALKARPGQPQALYLLAVAEAARGRADAALAALQAIADMGLTRDAREDAALAPLRGHPGFAAVTAALAANGAPRGSAAVLARHRDRRLLSFGLADDRDRQRLLLSSYYRREVAVVGQPGRRAALLASGQYGLLAALGMQVERRRGLLWIATAALPQMLGHDPALDGRSAVLAVTLDDGGLSRRFELPEDRSPWRVEHIALGDGRRLYASDRAQGRIVAIDRISGRVETLVDAGRLADPRGLALSADGRWLYVADHARGLHALSLDDGRLLRLAPPPGACLYGLESLAMHGRSLIAVQPGTRPQRVLRLVPDPGRSRVAQAEVLLSAHPAMDDPGQGLVRGDEFLLLANTHRGRLADDERLPADAPLRYPTILRIGLPEP